MTAIGGWDIVHECDDGYHVVWLLSNDKGEELAHAEGFRRGENGGYVWYPYAMDPSDPEHLIRLGPSAHSDIELVKKQCEAVIEGSKSPYADSVAYVIGG